MSRFSRKMAAGAVALLSIVELLNPLVAYGQRVPQYADLATSIVSSVSSIAPGTKNIQVNFKTGNNGPATISKSTTRVLLPQGITVQVPPAQTGCRIIKWFDRDDVECTTGSLKPNSAAYYSMTVQTSPTMRCPQSLAMFAKVMSSSHPDSNTSNNTSSQPLSVICVAQPKLSISFDGPVTQTYKPGTKDVVFANVKMEASTDMNVSQEVLMVQGFAALKNLPGGGIAMIDTFVQNVELRNKVTGQTVPAYLFQRVTSPDGNFGLYRISNFVLKQGVSAWELRGDFTVSTQGGDKFRAGTCTTASGSSDPLCKFSTFIPPSPNHSLVATTLNGQRVLTVRPGGVMTGNYQLVGVPTLSVAQKATASSDTATVGQKNIGLLKFEARANDVEDVLLTHLSFRNADSDLTNVVNYTLWVDTNADGAVDTILQKGAVAANGFVSFDKLTGGGYVIPKSVSVVFEVHGDVASSVSSKPFQLTFATNQPTTYVEAEAVADGASLLGISTDGVCTPEAGYPACQVSVLTAQATRWTFVGAGNLFVTKSATPIRVHQLLGGTLADEVLRLQFRADQEDIDVTTVVLTATGADKDKIVQNVDRFELYKIGATTPFAVATVGACGMDSVPPYSFCASMNSQALVVPKGTTVNVLVRPRMRTDIDGAVSGQFVTIMVDDAIFATGATIRARGLQSSVNLRPNDGDTVAEGEIFIGTDTPAPNRDIVGNKNVVVLSKVVSLTNANPDPNGTPVPVGVQPVGQFKFSAAVNTNAKNGINKWTLTNAIFSVSAQNVQFGGTGAFKFYNKADPTVKSACYPLDSSPTQPNFFVACWDAATAGVQTSIDPGSDATFVLEANIQNPAVSRTLTSALVVSLDRFSDPTLTGMASNLSHIRWIDKDAGPSVSQFWWIEYPETQVRSTQYIGARLPSQADLSVSAPQMSPSTVRTGTRVTFTQVVKNLGPGSPMHVSFRTNIPETHLGDKFEFLASPSSSSTCAIDPNDAGTILCKDVPLGPLGSTVMVSFMVPATAKCPVVAAFHTIVQSELDDPNMNNNVGDINSIDVQCGTVQKTGSLFITAENEVPSPYNGFPGRLGHQLLGGTIGDTSLKLKFHAVREDMDVRALRVTMGTTSVRSLDRLEFYKENAVTPFAVATTANCGETVVPGSFCATMNSGTFVVSTSADMKVLVRPRIKTDVDGAVAGDKIQLTLAPNPLSIKATGVTTKGTVRDNNGDTNDDGEIFVGTTSVGPDGTARGQEHVVVLSKITSVVNAAPDANTNPPVPVGIAAIGQYKFAAASNVNSKNGNNTVAVDRLIFSLTATNVAMGSQDFKVYNKADPSQKASCVARKMADMSPITGDATGYFYVDCNSLTIAPVNANVQSGSDTTFVLEGKILNPMVNTTQWSTLSTGLAINVVSWTEGSHVIWFDSDAESSNRLDYVESPRTDIAGTRYESGPAPVITSLFVTQDTTPVRQQQILGGAVTDPLLRLKFDVSTTRDVVFVTDLHFTIAGGGIDAIDRLELVPVGMTNPIGVATVGACGSASVPPATMCATLGENFFINGGSPVVLQVRARMKTDVDGAVSGGKVRLTVLGTVDLNAVKAASLNTSLPLKTNDGDATDEGEIFIGRSNVGANADISGSEHTVVLSKVVSVTNADPNANGTAIPTGFGREISQLKFSAAPNNNTLNGLNKVALGNVLYSVTAQNVLLSGSGFAAYNKADSTQVVLCYPMSTTGTPLAGDVTGTFLVSCAYSGSPVNNSIDPGTDATFVLRANVMNSKVDNGAASVLQVMLSNFPDSTNTSFGPSASHLTWHDEDLGESKGFFWIDSPNASVNGTAYSN